MRIFTIGFTKKGARRYFELLRESGAKHVVDVRLNNVSQLAGFAKKDDLANFLDVICGVDYVHLPELAPTADILDGFKNREIDWRTYEKRFPDALKQRRVGDSVPRRVISNACLLCSEDKPEHCHRLLVAEYLGRRWGDVETHHLV